MTLDNRFIADALTRDMIFGTLELALPKDQFSLPTPYADNLHVFLIPT